MKQYSYRSNHRRNKIITRAVIAVLLLAITVTAIMIINLPNRVRSLGSNLKVMPFNAENFTPFAKGAVYTTKDGKLYHINEKGVMDWGFTQLDSSIKLSTSDKYLLCYGGNKLQVISDEGMLYISTTFDGEILNAKSSSELICVSIRENDGSIQLVVLSAPNKGEILGSLSLLSEQILLDFGISDTEEEVWILSVEETSSPIYHVDIHRYEPDHKLIASLSVDSEAIYSVILNKKGLFLTGTQNLRTYNTTNQLKEQQTIYGQQLLSCTSSEKQATHIFSTVKKPYSSVTIFQNGTKPNKIVLETASDNIIIRDNHLYTFSRNKMLVYSLTGKKTATYALPHPVDKIITLENEDIAYFIFDGKVSLLKLP